MREARRVAVKPDFGSPARKPLVEGGSTPGDRRLVKPLVEGGSTLGDRRLVKPLVEGGSTPGDRRLVKQPKTPRPHTLQPGTSVPGLPP